MNSTKNAAAKHKGRADYADRKAARIDRLSARADRTRAASARAYGAAKRIADAIPFGQPILVGHHSEGRSRRDARRIEAGMRKAVELHNEAERTERRLATSEANNSISSDDPEAVAKLTEKIAKLEAEQARMKATNAIIRKHAKAETSATIAALVASGVSQGMAVHLLKGDGLGNIGHAPYVLTGHSAEIRRCKARIELLAKQAARPEVNEQIGDVRIVESDNRTQVYFPGKPDEATRVELKRAGFRWAPSVGAWQRQASAAAVLEARRIAARAT
jgi:hypothetical protein